ncbi:MAG: hypothetical protein HKN55_02410 [Woeseiaceae bacterium]|nr:hypothetical protein [Woeseiaceae bacterium]
MNRKKTAFITIALLSSGMANAQWSANLGFASDYFFRGIFQAQSSAFGGIDYEQNGFYAGVWAADVGDGLSAGYTGDDAAGLEVDGYFGYGGEVGDFSYGIGYTGYFYTEDFDDTYQEINLSGGYGIATVEVAIGQYENFSGPTLDYTYYALTLEKNGFYGKYAGIDSEAEIGPDVDGQYFELGYGATVADIDLGVYVLLNDKMLSLLEDNVSGAPTDGTSIVFTIGKSFDLN